MLRRIERLADSPIGRLVRRQGADIVSSAKAKVLYTWRLPPTMKDRSLYRPLFQPWLSQEWRTRLRDGDPHSFVAADAKFVMYRLLDQAAGTIDGDVAECGVFRGGTARLMAELLRDRASSKMLHLFDTFEGMPETDSSRDLHKAGDFGNTSLAAVRSYVEEASYGNVSYHAGLLPGTLSSVTNSSFCFVHIDLDIYKPIIDTTAFFYERVPRGAFLLYDDYAWPSCPGARQAVDEFYADKPEKPLVLATGQCLVVKA